MSDKDQKQSYSDAALMDKLAAQAKKAGKVLVLLVLQLYYALHNPQTPKWAKTVIMGALAYFIVPFDAVPDLIPGIGYTDDLGTLSAAVALLTFYIDEKVKAQAETKLRKWFD